MSGLVIAIDGPSASGKSTVSQNVAQRLNFIHVDSGSLYRGITLYFLSHRNFNLVGSPLVGDRSEDGRAQARPLHLTRKNNTADSAVIAVALKQMRMDFMVRDNAVKFSIDGVEPDAALRSEAVNNTVSQIAALPAVREWVVNKLREMPVFGDLVMEGRDIGTAVFPEAMFKFYLDAAPEERARRRHLEMAGLNKGVPAYDDILRSILKRDGIDSSRALAPLKVAPGAVVIQSTTSSIVIFVD